MAETVRTNLERVAVQSNPPPDSCRSCWRWKNCAWRLVARQMLGPSWESTTHVLQARDLAKTAGAMKKFEEFLRPEGTSSSDTLAGRSSLDSFDALNIGSSGR